MRKLTLILIALLVSMAATAKRRVYIELLGHQKSMFSTQVKVTVDSGQSTSFWKGTKVQQLVSENGKDMNFNSMVGAMNYMGQYGWKFAQAYVVTVKDWGSSNVNH